MKQPIDCRNSHQSIEHSANPDTRDLLPEALAITFAKDQTQELNIPVKVPLGGGKYAELTEWNASKRVDLRFWKTDTIPTKVGVSLTLPQ
jgi:hypothetical protein